MKQENWVESQWLKSVELKKKLPFEDTAFIELYRSILPPSLPPSLSFPLSSFLPSSLSHLHGPGHGQ